MLQTKDFFSLLVVCADNALVLGLFQVEASGFEPATRVLEVARYYAFAKKK